MFRVACRRAPEGANSLTPSTYFKNCELKTLHKTTRNYSKHDLSPPDPKGGRGGFAGTGYTIVGATLLTAGTAAYAKYDPQFRKWLSDNVPYSDDFVRFVFQENKSYSQSFGGLVDSTKAIVGLKPDKRGEIVEKPKSYQPPTPAFSTLAADTKVPAEAYQEIRTKKITAEDKTPVITVVADTHPKNIADLERTVADLAKTTVQGYNTALYAMKNYNKDIYNIVEDSIDTRDSSVWSTLEENARKKSATLKTAEENAEDTVKNIQKLKELIESPDCKAPTNLKLQTKLNLAKINKDLDLAKKQYQKELESSDVADKYWKKVEESRRYFEKELKILFPAVDLRDRKLNLDTDQLDLFILHAHSTVCHYQKELAKLQTLEKQKLNAAIEIARHGNPEMLSEFEIESAVNREKDYLRSEFEKKCLLLRKDAEKELRRQLRIQSETFTDHLDSAVKAKEVELERKFARSLEEKLNEERCKNKVQISAMVGRLRGLDEALKARAESDKISKQAQVLWSASQALYRSIRASCPGLSWRQQLRPLEPEINAVSKAAAPSDELVKVVIDGIPAKAKARGVFPEDALRERFLKVEKVARELSLVPEGGGRLPLYFLSYLQSMLLLKSANPIPQSELNDEKVNFSKLTNNEILQRARYWVDRGDFAQSLRYMNLLKGASRSAARQWMEETRLLLETQQAANTLMAHAAAVGLVYL